MNRMSHKLRKAVLAVLLSGAALGLSACHPSTTSVSTGVGVYYDSMLWNDYYYRRPYYPPAGAHPPHRPPPGARPPHRPPPAARPPAARPPIHRPPAGGGRPRRR